MNKGFLDLQIINQSPPRCNHDMTFSALLVCFHILTPKPSNQIEPVTNMQYPDSCDDLNPNKSKKF